MSRKSGRDHIASLIKEKSIFATETRQYTQTSRLTKSGEITNRSVQYYIELLEILLGKLKLAKAQGMWRTMSYFFSPSLVTTKMMGSILKNVFSGDNSQPEAIRTMVLNGIKPSIILSKFKQIELALNYHPAFSAEHPLRKIIKHKLSTVLTSRDLATLTHLPKEEMPGYDVRDTARFGVCLPKKQVADNLFIGEIIDRGRGTGNYYSLPIKDLVKHGLVVGVTGSGKTNTCLILLDQLWREQSKIPFLVIEPAKAEYRDLLNVEGFKDLQIFTLGDETTSPFRLNPFEIMEGVKLQTHIDKLRAVFNASFIMYAPMPYVLERCLHEIYKDKGWDLTTNKNRFLDISKMNPYGIFPTLTDLYNKIDPVVDAMGYDDKLTIDIKASLKARIGNLRIGGKGAMLDTSLSIPMDTLLKKPTILELQSIGDDEEKAFIIGLLIARLYEYREIENKQNRKSTGLKHVTLIEEAHRLLTKTSNDFSNLENVSTKAKAVETFCNILSEIRAFGEGILIAEQIPVKLAQDAIKNTNLKIMHRIVAKDDRDLMGHSMCLDENQNKYISILGNGEAAVFSEGFNEPFLLKIPHYLPSSSNENVSDEVINLHMTKIMIPFTNLFGKHNGCKQCQNKCTYKESVDYILSDANNLKVFNKYILSIIESPFNFSSKYSVIKDSVLFKLKTHLIKENELSDVMFCFLINAGELFFQTKGIQYNLSPEKRFMLLNAYFTLINSYFSVPVKTQLSTETEKYLNEFQSCYLDIFSDDTDPFPGCNEFCKSKCLFRYDVDTLIKDVVLDKKLLKAIRSSEGARGKVRDLCIEVAHNLTIDSNDDFIENIALCFFIQKSSQWNVTKVVNNINQWFFNKKEII